MSAAMCLTGILLTTALSGENTSAPVTCVEPGYYWLMPEDFTERGGWKLDTQFVHLTGSSRLIAAGTLDPVDDVFAEAAIADLQCGRGQG